MTTEKTLGQLLHETRTRLLEEARAAQEVARRQEQERQLARFKDGLQSLKKSISATIYQGHVPDDIVFPEDSPEYDGLVQAIASRFDEPLRFSRKGGYLDAWNGFVQWAQSQQLRIHVSHPERCPYDDGRPTLYDFTLEVLVDL